MSSAGRDSTDEPVEFGVVAVYDERALARELIEESDELAILGAKVGSNGDLAEKQMRFMELAAPLIDVKRAEDGAELMGCLSSFAADFTGRELSDDRMIVNAAFTVERARVTQFVSAIESLRCEHEGRMHFEVSGPITSERPG